jgi:fused signal recognition particle receptor
MFWRRRPTQPDLPMDDGPVTDAEIEAQLEAELAEPDAAEPTAEGARPEPEGARTERGGRRMEPPPSSAQVAAGDDEVRAGEPAISPSSPGFADAPLAAGVERSRGGFMARLKGILGRGDPDAATWEEVEETLIAGDVGAALALEVVDRARRRRDGGGPVAAVRSELGALLVERETGWVPYRAGPDSPAIILVVGVNGTGKTTTIGKLAFRYRAEGQSVLLAAGDTFRAAAIEQLRAWGDRAGAAVVAHAPGADPSAVVYDAVDAAVARHVDVLIADTAGRLHTKSNLMDELAKMRRVIDRRLPGAVPEVLFVLDATTGQNGLAQAKAFHESTGLTGIILTKLDSTAKGGIVFAIEQALGVPVRFVGVGEQVADLLPFDPAAFVGALFG